ncbi:MAG TPA: retropepsin-like aspartic protease [Acetobacteraceae bacterium]|nr:retropepsin-like aspartic protease [Acetobacteraceae bacterium]
MLVLVSSGAQGACRLERAADVPVRVVEGFPIVSASIGAKPVSLLLDTGAQGHLVLPDAVTALGLQVLPGTVPVVGTGGTSQAPVAVIEGLRLGSVSLPPAPAPVIPLPALPRVSPMLAGLLGAPLLARYDLDLDVAAGRIGLYEAGGCGAAVPALGPLMTVVRLQITPDREALLPVRVNGQDLIAVLDTGSRATLLTEAAGRRLGLHAPVSANTATGVDGQRLPLQHVRVRELSVGDDVRRDAPVSIAPLQLGPADMLLGLDYLRQRRVWISYVTGQLAIALPSPAASAR